MMIRLPLALLALAVLAACDRSSSNQTAPPTVVVYTSVDRQISEKVLKECERKLNLRIEMLTDDEVTKSVGLAERLEAERSQPRADVWWGNEPFHTINLAEAGLLAPYDSPAASDIPARYKDPTHRWASSGLRLRVIAVTTAPEGKSAAGAIRGLEDLANPALKGRITMAQPQAGTTSGHMAALYTLWGEDRFTQFLMRLKANDMRLVGGNGVVVQMVGKGTLWAGLTDNDDVANMMRKGGALAMVIPDQDGIGTLPVPTTVALVTGSRQVDHAKRVVDYLLSKEVEQAMLDAQFIHASVRAGPGSVKAMEVDLREVAKNMKAAVLISRKVLAQ